MKKWEKTNKQKQIIIIMEITKTLMSEGNSRIAQITIKLASGAEVVLDDSCFEEEGGEAVLIKSKPGETKYMGTGDVDLNVCMMDAEIVDIMQPNIEYKARNILKNLN